MSIYYQDDRVTLYHGDCREVMAGMAAGSVDVVITDPPYSSQVHSGARTRTTGARSNALVTFDKWTPDLMRATFDDFGRVTNRWVVATMDWSHAALLHAAPPQGLRFIRLGAWVKPNSTPQLTCDRPAQGWEAVAILHADRKGRMQWNGGGKRAVWTVNTINATDHPTAKPLPLVGDFVGMFTNPGETVLDPFAGSGTTLIAARQAGRRAIGIERDEAYCEVIAKRLSQGVLDFGEVTR